MDPTVWGPKLWFFIHTLALNFPTNPTFEEVKAYESFFDNLKFSPGEDVNNAISEEDISNSVLSILKLSRNTVVDEINLSPLTQAIKFT